MRIDKGKRIALYLAIGLACVYGADWGVFEARQVRGAGMRSIQVQKYLRIPLKGNKDEYDFNGTEDRSCSVSMLPQYAASNWNPSCWWLERHKVSWESARSARTHANTSFERR